MDWKARRMKRLTNRRAYAREASEFFADLLMQPTCPPAVAARCRARLDELDEETTYLEGAILRLKRKEPQ